MSLIRRSKAKLGLFAPAIMTVSILLAAPAAQAGVGIGINLGVPPVVEPPVVVGPRVIAPPPVVVGPPAYYASRPRYFHGPGPRGRVFWYDRFGHRHWR